MKTCSFLVRNKIAQLAQKKYKIRWHKGYNQRHDYSTQETERKPYTWAEVYLIWNKRVQGGRILTDVTIAKLLQRSLQAIQLKRHKMKMEGHDREYKE